MKELDDVSKIVQQKCTGVSVDELLRLQRKWSPLFKAATKPAALIGQKYV